MNMTHEDYCSYEQSKRLKELGFDWDLSEPKVERYNIKGKTLKFEDYKGYRRVLVYEDYFLEDLYYLPTLSQAQKWIREKGISVEPFSSVVGKDWAYQLYHTQKDKFGLSVVVDKKCVKEYGYATYEQALSVGIDKALEILKEQEDGNQD